MSQVKIIAFAGLQWTGKTTLAILLEESLKISRLDVDEIRRLLFKYHPVDTEIDREQDEKQMKVSWRSMFALAEYIVETGYSVIMAGTFSRKIQHESLLDIVQRYKIGLKVVYCFAPDEVIGQRTKLRADKNFSLQRKLEGYFRVKERYEKISAPDILELDTSQSIELCLEKIIQFIR